MYYVVHKTKRQAKTFESIVQARRYAQMVSNKTKRKIEIDKATEVGGRFAGQSYHSSVKPKTRKQRIATRTTTKRPRRKNPLAPSMKWGYGF